MTLNRARQISPYLLAALFVGAGITHFLRPKLFDSIVPGWAAPGLFPSVRSVTLLVLALDNVVGQLTVNAERVSGNAGNVLYSFTVLDGLKSLVNGRAIVVLDSPDPVTSPAAA